MIQDMSIVKERDAIPRMKGVAVDKPKLEELEGGVW